MLLGLELLGLSLGLPVLVLLLVLLLATGLGRLVSRLLDEAQAGQHMRCLLICNRAAQLRGFI